jgi:hypothetical protein
VVINEKAHNPAIPADILHFIRSRPKLNLSKAPSIIKSAAKVGLGSLIGFLTSVAAKGVIQLFMIGYL